MKTLNLGCATVKITDAVNVDMNPEVKPDLCFDIRKKFPLESKSFDKVLLFHCLEHIEKFHHQPLFFEIHRILKDDGALLISYPEFSEILNNWLTNKNADRPFWHATIYGRQNYTGDYHQCGIHTPELIQDLQTWGFMVEKNFVEPLQSHNTVLHCRKVAPPITYEEVLYKEVFGR